MNLAAMVDAIAADGRSPALKGRELRHQLLVVDKPDPPAGEEREGLDIDLRRVALAVAIPAAVAGEALDDEAGGTLVAGSDRETVALEECGAFSDRGVWAEGRLDPYARSRTISCPSLLATAKLSCPTSDAASTKARGDAQFRQPNHYPRSTAPSISSRGYTS
jgi:hypothetical protein